MTQMGLNYLQHLETSRANRASEAWRADQLRETARHNVVTEGINTYDAQTKRGTLDELVRSNQTREVETYRSNLAREQHALSSLEEAIRSNKARELENVRSNKVSESIKRTEAAEKKRANQAKEAQASRDTNLKYMGKAGAAYDAYKDEGYTSTDAMLNRLEDFVMENAFGITKAFGRIF